MRGKSTRPIRTAGRSRNALVRRHARLTPDESRPLRLDATQQQRSLRVNFPLSTYSAFGEENVSRGNENTFEGLKKTLSGGQDNRPLSVSKMRLGR